MQQAKYGNGPVGKHFRFFVRVKALVIQQGSGGWHVHVKGFPQQVGGNDVCCYLPCTEEAITASKMQLLPDILNQRFPGYVRALRKVLLQKIAGDYSAGFQRLVVQFRQLFPCNSEHPVTS